MDDRPRRPRGGLPPPVPRGAPRALARLRNEHISESLAGPLPSIAEGGSAAEESRHAPESGEASGDACLDLMGDVSRRDWKEVFEERGFVEVDGDRFCYYASALGATDNVVTVLLHGGGHCALSWGMVAEILKKSCGVLAFDARGHGDTLCKDQTDISADTQIADAAAVIRAVFAKFDRDLPTIVLIGHSMGGAIAVRLAASGLLGKSLKGLVVIDVVEGTAVAALPFMHAWLQKRPKSFGSVARGVRYVVRAGHVRNVDSARLSVPRQLVRVPGKSRWVWRTDLETTQQYWRGWYEGLSKMFLSVPTTKMLVLAGIDRLDKDLTIAQMQGKFQNIVIPGAGHVVHEDRPEQTASVVLGFLRRNLLIESDEGLPGVPPVFQQRGLPRP